MDLRGGAGLGPDDVLVVVSAYGMEPVPLWRRLFSRPGAQRHPRGRSRRPDPGRGGRHPARRDLLGASVLDVAPTLLYLSGLPVGRDMEGRVLAEMVEEGYAGAHPVSYIPSYESLAAHPGPPPPPLEDLPPLPDEEP